MAKLWHHPRYSLVPLPIRHMKIYGIDSKHDVRLKPFYNLFLG